MLMEKENDMLISLEKPYSFEGEEYSEIDLSGLNNITGDDVCRASKVLGQKGVVAAMPEVDPTYCALLASTATGKPFEFFAQMPAPLFKKVTRRVSHFLLAGDSAE